MLSAFSCSCCGENFDGADHKPICLPCGHTFCLDCVRRLEAAKIKSCFSCCRPVNRRAEQLPVVYALMGLDENEATVRCKFHTHELEYWCVPCQESLCKKCVKVQHGDHRVEFMEDLMDNEACAADANAEIYCQLKTKQDRLSSAILVRTEILAIFEEGKSVIAEISKEKDLLAALKESVDRDVETWKGGKNTPSTAEGKRQLFRDIVHRSKKIKAPKDEEILRLENKLLQLVDTMAFLSSDDSEPQFLNATDDELGDTSEDEPTNQDESPFMGIHPPEDNITEAASSSTPASPVKPLLPCDGHWKITNNAEAEQAVADVRAGLMPRQMTVKSTLTDPILDLSEIIPCLGRACCGRINLKLLDTFWAPQSVPSANFLTFIEEFGHKVRLFYGSTKDALAISSFRNTRTSLGVRLTCMSDVDKCTNAYESIWSVCCLPSLPGEAGVRMAKLMWEPRCWHFPDLQDIDLGWLHDLVKPMPNSFHRHLYLPGCRLTEKGFRKLLASSYFFAIYCDPQGSLQLSEDVQLRLSNLCAHKNISLQWATPLDKII